MSTARRAGLCYTVTIVTGTASLFTSGMVQSVNGALAGISYVAVTWLFYRLFAPVHKGVSAAAAIVGLTGCFLGLAGQFGLLSVLENPLPVFGVYCGLIGWLILRSSLPRTLGVLMIIGGIGWLTFAFAKLTAALAPFNLAPGILGETLLTLWLLATGRNPERRTP